MFRTLLAAPFLLLLVLFALSNRQPIEFKLWPTDNDDTVTLPLSLAVLGAMAIAFILGALVLWTSALGARRRARRAERQALLLEAQVAELKAKLARPTVPQATATIGSRALLPAGR